MVNNNNREAADRAEGGRVRNLLQVRRVQVRGGQASRAQAIQRQGRLRGLCFGSIQNTYRRYYSDDYRKKGD